MDGEERSVLSEAERRQLPRDKRGFFSDQRRFRMERFERETGKGGEESQFRGKNPEGVWEMSSL